MKLQGTWIQQFVDCMPSLSLYDIPLQETIVNISRKWFNVKLGVRFVDHHRWRQIHQLVASKLPGGFRLNLFASFSLGIKATFRLGRKKAHPSLVQGNQRRIDSPPHKPGRKQCMPNTSAVTIDIFNNSAFTACAAVGMRNSMRCANVYIMCPI